MRFGGVNSFSNHRIINGQARRILRETGMSVKKQCEMVSLARKMDLFGTVYVGSPDEPIIAHVGTPVGGSIDATNAVITPESPVRRVRLLRPRTAKRISTLKSSKRTTTLQVAYAPR